MTWAAKDIDGENAITLSRDRAESDAGANACSAHLLAAIVLALVTLVMFWPLTIHPTEVLVGPQREGLNDLTAYYIPSRQYAVEMQQKFGEFPAWNPHVSLGVGYVGNPQSALYYPPNWICHWIDASIALSWLLVVHHWWAGFGAYLLLRSMGCRWGSALFAGIAALAGPYWLAHAGEGHYAQICAASWIPWGMLAYRSVCRGDRLGVIAMAFVLAMSFFCNHVQETYYLVLILSLFLAGDAVSLMYRKKLRSALQLIGRWIAVGVLTAGVVCIDLIPIQIYSYSSMRAVFRQSGMQINEDLFLKRNFTQLLDPFLMGTPDVYEVQFTPYCEMALYFGVIPCVLAGMGIAGGRRQPGVMRLSLLLAGTLLFALGRSGPLFPLLYEIVPGIAWFRGPGRILFFTQILVAMLAGFGVDWAVKRLNDATSNGREPFVRLPLFAAVCYGFLATLLIGLMMPSGLELTTPEILQRIWQRPILWFWLIAPAAALFMGVKFIPLKMQHWRSPFVTGVLSLLTLLESGLFAREAITTRRPISFPAQATRTGNSSTEETADGAFDLHQLAAASGEGGTYPRVVTQQLILSDQRAAEIGIHRLRGYDPLMLTYYFVAMLHLSPDENAPVEQMGFWIVDLAKMRMNLIDLYGVKYALWPAGNSLSLPEGWIKRWTGRLPPLVARADDDIAEKSIPVEVWENPDALPRAFIVGQAEQPKTFDDLSRQLETFDPRKTVLLEKDVLPPGPRSEYRPATITKYSPNRVTVAAELDRPGYLVLTDLFHPGWTATDNGKAMPIMLGDLAFRVVPLEAGRHDVEFAFRPVGYQQGKIVTLMSLLIVAIISVNRLRRPKMLEEMSEDASSLSIERRSDSDTQAFDPVTERGQV
ncbi:MAG: YfhO family protein [Planctomycetaceae bacterium]